MHPLSQLELTEPVTRELVIFMVLGDTCLSKSAVVRVTKEPISSHLKKTRHRNGSNQKPRNLSIGCSLRSPKICQFAAS